MVGREVSRPDGFLCDVSILGTGLKLIPPSPLTTYPAPTPLAPAVQQDDNGSREQVERLALNLRKADGDAQRLECKAIPFYRGASATIIHENQQAAWGQRERERERQRNESRGKERRKERK